MKDINTSTQLRSIQKFYNAVSPIYYWTLFPFFSGGWKKCSEKIKAENYSSVLELACGEAPILKYLPSKIDYTGIDISEKSIKKANRKYNSKFILHDVEQVSQLESLPPNSFDCVLLLYCLSVTPNPDALIQEARKLLKNGGNLLIVNHFSSSFFYRMIDWVGNQIKFKGLNFYFPFPTNNQLKGFNIVSQKNIRLFWTFLHLKKT